MTPDKRLSEAELETLLRRAAEIDAEHRSSANLADVQLIAQEVGITPAAVDEAYREISRRRPDRATLMARRFALLTGVTAGVVYVSWWSGAIASDGVAVSDLVGLVAGSAVATTGTWGLAQSLVVGSRKLLRKVWAYVAPS